MRVLSWLSRIRGGHPRHRFDEAAVAVQLHAELDRLTTDAAGQRQEASQLSPQLARDQRNFIRRVHGHVVRTDRSLRNIDTRLAVLRRAISRQADRSSHLITGVERVSHEEDREKTVIRRLGRVADRNRPIIAGPWTGDPGAELLYWVPFVRWVAGRFHIAPDRLHVVSSGGPSCWYRDITSNYIDLTSCCSPDELASWRVAGGRFRAFDRMVLGRVKERIGGGSVSVMHPGLIDRLFGSRDTDDVPVERVLRHNVARRIRPPSSTELALPSRYVAAWFPFSPAFPDTPANRVIAADTLASLAEDGDVVLLDTNPAVREALTAGHDRLHSIDHLVPAERRLDIQTAVIAGAQACIGSVSGLAYVASLCGVRSLTLYSVRELWRPPFELMDAVIERVDGGPMTELDVASRPLVASVLDVRGQMERPDIRPVA